MAQTDLDLSFDGALYALADPITDQLDRVRNRFRVQFLSCRKSDGRGSRFYSRFKAGQLKTNAQIGSLFAITAAEIVAKMRDLQQDIYPERAVLNDVIFTDSESLRLEFTLVTSEGNVVDNIEVTT